MKEQIRTRLLKWWYRLEYLGVLNWIDDRKYLELLYKLTMGYDLTLEAPITFNEKLQWLKLYNRRPEYTAMVDKYKVREYIADKIGAQYLIPLLGVWDNPNDIDFGSLPNQFVLKCNHNSGLGMCICRNKANIEVEKVRADLFKGMKENYYLHSREWPYKDVNRKIIAEKYMSDGTNDPLMDYKVLCFNGEPRLIEIHRGRFTDNHTQDFYDTDWNITKFEQPEDPLSGIVMEKPVFSEEMLQLTRTLAKGIPHVRVDWYYVNGQLYFGEMTFFDGAGFSPFLPGQDEIIGSWLTLPEKTI